MVASCVIEGAFSRNVVCVVYLCFEFSFLGEIYEELLKLQDDYYCYRKKVGFKKGKKAKKRLD